MTHRIKVTDWLSLGRNMIAERSNGNTPQLQLIDAMHKYDVVSNAIALLGLPTLIRIPISMDLQKELSYFALTVYSTLDDNIIEFVWE